MDGQPECIQETFSTCWLAGGPRYCSFDGKTFDFMGTCAYTLTTICDPNPTLPAFSVEVKKKADGNSKVSSIGSITIHVDNVTVTAVPSENGMVRVSSHHSHLPMSLSHGKLHVYRRVLYKWDDHVVINLLAAFSGKVCGMCRNNRDLWDDALPLDGKQACDNCGVRGAGSIYVKNCIYDLCANEGHRNVLCHAFEIYTDDCQEEGSMFPIGGQQWDVMSRERLMGVVCGGLAEAAEATAFPRVSTLGRDSPVSTRCEHHPVHITRWYVAATSLPNGFANPLCGLCGNYIGAASNNIMMRNNHVTSDPDAFGSSWKVIDVPGCSEKSIVECSSIVTPSWLQQEVSGMGCEIILEVDGPFRACHGHVDGHQYFQSCIHDSCLFSDQEEGMCPIIALYTTTCQAADVSIESIQRILKPVPNSNLNNLEFPPPAALPFPENICYEPCGNACAATCSAWDSPATCDQPCVETCACNTGHVLRGGQGMPVANCGCTHDGCYYHPGEEFWSSDTCHFRCRCDMELVMVVCKDSRSKLGEVCVVVKGMRDAPSVCLLVTPTFDGHCYYFMGSCVYLLAAHFSTDPTLIPFAVTVEDNHCGSCLVSFTKMVTMEVYNMTLSQEHPQRVKVNGVLLDLPFTHSHQLQVSLHGIHGFITTDTVVTVTFDWYRYAHVIIPNTTLVLSVAFVAMPVVTPTMTLSPVMATMLMRPTWGTAGSEGCQVCSDAQKCACHGDKHWRLLGKKRGPFATCHNIIKPAPYLDDCLIDTCLYRGRQDTVCQAIAAYVAACQSQSAAMQL
ncbi:hypothetical protein DV515_00015510 [Chloebia gouldiae]|uniref:VWFD domain-containing protein n=1 Tax=Chloebia gouldiae TaxID=44316 RepID=A0A3L8RVB6_CHLGU|nr:hypothetical protein DV515_00015510 [Chloebia gouldiae]